MSLLSLFAHTSSDPGHVDTANVPTDALLAGVFVFFIVLIVLMYVTVALLLARIFKKAGVKGWKAWVPVYNTWTTLELGGQKGWWSLLTVAPIVTWFSSLGGSENMWFAISLLTFIVSIVGTVYLYIAMYKIGLRFGKEGYFVLWAIFLPIVWYAWLALDKSTWKGPEAPLADTKTPAEQ